MHELLLHDHLRECRSAHEIQALEEPDPGLLQVVVEHDVVDVPQRIEVAEASLNGDSAHAVALIAH